MYKKKIILLPLILLLSSCDFFDFEIKNRNNIAKEQLNEIKLRGLDTYPLLNHCNEETQKASKKCFEKQLISHISAYFLDQEILENSKEKRDTLWINILVSEKGNLSLKLNERNNNIPDFELIKHKLEESLSDISPIKPAAVQGKSVSCVFKLPLTINY